MAGQSTGMQRKYSRVVSLANFPDTHNLFGEVPTPTPTDLRFYVEVLEDMINEYGQGYDEEEIQDAQAAASQDTHDQYNDGQDPEDGEGVDVDGEPLEFEDELEAQGRSQKRRKSVRTGAYTEDLDKLMCDAWMKIGQDPKPGAKQKGTTIWKRFHDYLHEHGKFEPDKFENDRTNVSIQK